MATMKVSLPDPMMEWIDTQVRSGAFASPSDYLRDLVRRDRVQRGQELTLQELRDIVAESKASGPGDRTLDDLLDEAARRARSAGGARG